MPVQYEPQQVQFTPRTGLSTDVAGPATNAAATLTMPGLADAVNVCPGVAWSYGGSGTLAGGRVTLKDGDNVIFQLDLIEKKENWVQFLPPRQGTPGNAMTAVLAAGGSNVDGTLNWLSPCWTRSTSDIDRRSQYMLDQYFAPGMFNSRYFN